MPKNEETKPVLYLDIDGVLLTKKQQVPEGTGEFLEFVLTHFECRWLTTHCKGDAQTALRYLTKFYPADLLSRLPAVQPTNWDALKTEGIDFAQPFFWIDDYPFEAEKAVLVINQRLGSLVVCNLNQTNELKRISDWLQAQILAASA